MWSYSNEEALEELVGQSVREVYVSQPRQRRLVVVCDDDVFEWRADGGCCSESFFAEILGLRHLLDGVVREVEYKGVDRLDDGTRQQYDEAYGYTIKTFKGRTDIVFRNSSNGYYSGSLTPVDRDEAPDGDSDDWERITDDDWEAI